MGRSRIWSWFVTAWFLLAGLECVVLSGIKDDTLQSSHTDGMSRSRRASNSIECPVDKETCSDAPDIDITVIPKRLLDEFTTLEVNIRRAIVLKNLSSLVETDVQSLPPAFIYLFPAALMSTLSPAALAEMVATYPDDAPIALKVVEALDAGDKREEFLTLLARRTLSDEVQFELGKAVIAWWPNMTEQWKYRKFQMALKAGSPLLVYLPNSFLFDFNEESAEKFVYHLRNWQLHTPHEEEWAKKPEGVQRVWMHLSIKSEFPDKLPHWNAGDVQGLGFLLLGATPDEIASLPRLPQESKDILFRTHFSRMQAHRLFDVFYNGSKTLHTSDMEELRPLLPLLSTKQYQKFDITSTDFHEIDFLPRRMKFSFPAAKQITQALIATDVLSGDLPGLNVLLWDEQISHLGKSVFTLAKLELEMLNITSAAVVRDLASDYLTPEQARILTRSVLNHGLAANQDFLESVGGNLLAAVSTSSIYELHSGSIPDQTFFHLLFSNPPTSRIRSAVLLQKARGETDRDSVIRSMLLNRNPSQYFELLSTRELSGLMPKILQILQESMNPEVENQFESVMKNLPRRVLSVFLTTKRSEVLAEDDPWTSNYLLQQKNSLGFAAAGLSCNDLETFSPIDSVVALRIFNTVRIAKGQFFPKELQYCGQKALLKHLKVKSLMKMGDGKSDLLSYLEPMEIAAVGGYIMASFPSEDIQKENSFHRILSTIGKLDLPELLLATHHKHKEYKQLIAAYLNESGKLGLQELDTLGSLVYFLQSDDLLSKTEAKVFRFYVESLEQRSKIVCGDKVWRKNWFGLVKAAFGNPSTWSAGTLAVLGDLLLVVPEEEKLQIPVESWVDAVETLVEDTLYLSKAWEWPGFTSPVSSVQICMEVLPKSEQEQYFLSYKHLMRIYLESMQRQVDAVKGARELLKDVKNFTAAEQGDRTGRILSQPSKLMVVPARMPYPLLAKDKIAGGKQVEKNETQHVATVSTSSSHTTGMKTSTTDFTTSVQPKSPSEGNVTHLNESSIHVTEAASNRTTNHSVHSTVAIVKPTEEVVKLRNAEGDDMLHKPSRDAVATVKLPARPHLLKTCDGIRAAGSAATDALEKFDLETLSSDDLANCIEALGSLDLSQNLKEKIWTLIKRYNITTTVLELGHLASKMPMEYLKSLNLSLPSSLDILAALSQELNDEEKMGVVVKKLIADNPELEPTAEVAIAVGKLVCSLSSSERKTILHSGSIFLHASSVLGHLESCHAACLEDLAKFALQPEAYGDSTNWIAEDFLTLGPIVAGLESDRFKRLRRGGENPLTGLTPAAVKCMPPELLQVLDEEQLSSISPLAAAVVSKDQRAILTEAQQAALDRVLEQRPNVTISLGADDPSVHKECKDCDKINEVHAAATSFLPSLYALSFSIVVAISRL